MTTTNPQPSSFAALEAAFELLCAGPSPLAIDGTAFSGLPARSIPLTELRVLLQHPATSPALRQAVIDGLFSRACQEHGAWTVGLGGVLLPGLQRIAACLAIGHHGAALVPDAERNADTEADLEVLRHLHAAARQQPPVELVGGRPRHPLVISLAQVLLTSADHCGSPPGDPQGPRIASG